MRVLLLFIFIFSISCKPEISRQTKVGILPYKGFSKTKTDTVAKAIATFYEVKTIVLSERELPKKAFIHVKSARYRADKIIRIQNDEKVDSLDFILGLTQNDISVTKKEKDGTIKKPIYKYEDWGIMGLAYCPGKSCIVSTFRIQNKDKKIHFTRLKKVAVHEFGHNLGLLHCSNKTCVMTDAVESVKTIDNANLALCSECKSKISF